MSEDSGYLEMDRQFRESMSAIDDIEKFVRKQTDTPTAEEEPTSIPAILAALADGCARIIEASARANSSPGPKDKERI